MAQRQTGFERKDSKNDPVTSRRVDSQNEARIGAGGSLKGQSAEACETRRFKEGLWVEVADIGRDWTRKWNKITVLTTSKVIATKRTCWWDQSFSWKIQAKPSLGKDSRGTSEGRSWIGEALPVKVGDTQKLRESIDALATRTSKNRRSIAIIRRTQKRVSFEVTENR